MDHKTIYRPARIALVPDKNNQLPPAFERGAFKARFAADEGDLLATQKLRHLCFVEAAGRAARANGIEADDFDSRCDHVLIEGVGGQLLCSYRLLPIASGAHLHTSYSAQYYDLTRLGGFDAPMVELGRFCVHPDAREPDILRIAWAMLAAYGDMHSAGMLFGCSSFHGTDPAIYRAAFDLLAARYLAPAQWQAEQRSPATVLFAATATADFDHKNAMSQIPPLLKTYLGMGGWVSDHVVIDHDMNTLHVFTGLEIAQIPAARAKALRAIVPANVAADGLAKDGASS